jgi:hypothetical protein
VKRDPSDGRRYPAVQQLVCIDRKVSPREGADTEVGD